MRLYSYVVARDFGFAPNPFFGVCTLATCKPDIRKGANVDDWVIGTGSQRRGRGNRIVFGMRITEYMTFTGYWSDPRFKGKKPYLAGSKKLAYGDNIYFKANGRWRQENSHHSLSTGKPNSANVIHDTRVDRVLISSDFIYWGGDGPAIPPSLRRVRKRGPGHRSDFDEAFIAKIISWLRSFPEGGYIGAPLDWSLTS
ncbi:MAG TPA: hypothetical protein VK130_04715 [Steroidobacteraceae bacterium]|nr:hypothetical protein [Steroidobacteraceae bacterium]